jgi:hypothetical protein
VTVSRRLEWTKRYTRRALTLAATAAALRAIHGPNVPMEKIKQAREKLIGSRDVAYTPGTDKPRVESEYMTIIDDEALSALENELNLVWERQSASWRRQRGEARMLAFAVESARRSWDKLAPYLSERQLAESDMTTDLIHFLLEKRFDAMVEVAKRDKAGAPWRAAFERSLQRGYGPHRHPQLEDFGDVPLSEWANTVLNLAVATRRTLREQYERERAQDTRLFRNEHLRPHVIKVDEPGRFIAETYDPGERKLAGTGWIVHGGQRLSNRKNEDIYVLLVDSGRVVYQHVGDKRFYEQSLEGFEQELLLGVYSLAGQKSLGAIKLSKWTVGLLGAVFFEVRWTMLAADLLSFGWRLQAHRKELEDDYDRVKLAYENVERLVPGLLPEIWLAVIDPKNLALLNPLAHPDLAAWIKVAIRLIMVREAYLTDMATALKEVSGILSLAWRALQQAFKGLLDAIIPIVVVGAAVAAGTGMSRDRAIEKAKRQLTQLGLKRGGEFLARIQALAPDDQQRLLYEIEDLGKSGADLAAIVKTALTG